jgi:hypothetical protein
MGKQKRNVSKRKADVAGKKKKEEIVCARVLFFLPQLLIYACMGASRREEKKGCPIQVDRFTASLAGLVVLRTVPNK